MISEGFKAAEIDRRHEGRREAGALQRFSHQSVEMAQHLRGVTGLDAVTRRLEPAQGAFRVTLTLPPGGGAGALSAALMALALAAGASDRAQITAAAVAVEGATDPLLAAAPQRLLWASRLGRTLAEMPSLPRFEVLGGFLGPGQRTVPLDEGFPDIADLVAAWPNACGVLKDMAALVSESARRTLARRGPATDPAEALAHRFGAFGHVIAHTGSARGLIFAPGMVPEAAEAGLRAAGFSRITRFGCGG